MSSRTYSCITDCMVHIIEFVNTTTDISPAVSTTTTTTTTSTTTTTAAVAASITSTTIVDTLDVTTHSALPVVTITTTTSLISSPIYTSISTSQSDDNNNSSVGVTVAIVVLVVVVLIIITVVVIGIIVVWKRKKSNQQTKPEGVYYSTINETMLQSTPSNKPEAIYSEMNDGQDSKEPQYMDVTKSLHSTEQADKIVIQDNPDYSENQVKMQPPAYSVTNM